MRRNATHQRHPDLRAFTGIFLDTPETKTSDLTQDIGRRVRYHTPRCTVEKDYVFTIREIQRIYDGSFAYRVYFEGDTFGRPACPDQITFVD